MLASTATACVASKLHYCSLTAPSRWHEPRDVWTSSTHQLAACCAAPPPASPNAAPASTRRPTPLLPRPQNGAPLYDEMRHLTRAGGDFTIHNYAAAVFEDLSEAATTVETELFPLEALDFYTRWNLEENITRRGN